MSNPLRTLIEYFRRLFRRKPATETDRTRTLGKRRKASLRVPTQAEKNAEYLEKIGLYRRKAYRKVKALHSKDKTITTLVEAEYKEIEVETEGEPLKIERSLIGKPGTPGRNGTLLKTRRPSLRHTHAVEEHITNMRRKLRKFKDDGGKVSRFTTRNKYGIAWPKHFGHKAAV